MDFTHVITGNTHEILCNPDCFILTYIALYSKFSENVSSRKVSLISYHESMNDLSTKNCVSERTCIIGLKFITSSSVLTFEVSIYTIRWVVEGIVPKNEKRVIQIVPGKPTCGDTLKGNQEIV